MKKIFFLFLFFIFSISSFAGVGNLYVPGNGLPGFDNGGKIKFGDIPFDTWVHNQASGGTNVPKRIAMFLIPLNYTTRGEWEQFELKGSTNNFSHLTPESTRLQYYAQSQIANTGADVGPVYSTTYDKMWCFVSTGYYGQTAGFHGDNRSYFWIVNTLPGIGWQHQMTTVVVLVDTTCLKRHPEGPVWLEDTNQDLMWVWHKWYLSGTNAVHETEVGRDSHLWRPIVPIRWFEEMPNWAWEQIPSLEEYYVNHD